MQQPMIFWGKVCFLTPPLPPRDAPCFHAPAQAWNHPALRQRARVPEAPEAFARKWFTWRCPANRLVQLRSLVVSLRVLVVSLVCLVVLLEVFSGFTQLSGGFTQFLGGFA